MKLVLAMAGCVLLAHAGDLPVFQVSDVAGTRIEFTALRGEITVVGFVSAKCPVSDAYNQRMIALYREYSAKGVRFVFLNPNANETVEDVKQQIAAAALPFPMYKDEDNRAAGIFGAQTTPEFFVLDARNAVRYQGAFDDSQNPARVKVHGLQEALDALLSGKPVAHQRLRAFGCTIHRVRHSS